MNVGFPNVLFATSLLLCLSINSASAEENLEPSPDDKLGSLIEKWETQREDLYSVEIRYRAIRRTVPVDHNVNRDKVRKLLSLLAEDCSEKMLVEVGVALDPRLDGVQPPWACGVFLEEGESFLCEESLLGNADSLSTTVRHLGYELRVRDRQNNRKQVVVRRSQSKKNSYGAARLGDFVVIPSIKILSGTNTTILQGKEKKARVSVSNKSIEFLVSTDTGFVHECSRGSYDKGKYYEALQFNPKKHGETAVMPELYFLGRYSGNRLSSFVLRVLDKVVTRSEEVSKSFEVGVVPGDSVIDDTGKNRERVIFQQPTADVIAGMLTPDLVVRIPVNRNR